MPLSLQARERLILDATSIMARYPQPRSALLPMLHLVQSEEGYVSPDGIALCADLLGLTTAEVSAVATFYTQYKRHPNGEYTVGVCTNTLCAVMGGDAVFAALEEHLGLGHDETTDDGKVTLERIECNAACDYAPVVMVNWEFFDNQTPASARELVDGIREGRPAVPTRGAGSVVTFRQMSRVLAGFSDGRAHEGVSAGTPTQRGTALAQQMGWTAPPAEDERGGAGGPDASTEPGRDADGVTPAATESAARDVQQRGAASSGTDAPAVPAGEDDRAGTTAGKPPGEATSGEGDDGSAATPEPAPDSTPENATEKEEG